MIQQTSKMTSLIEILKFRLSFFELKQLAQEKSDMTLTNSSLDSYQEDLETQ